MAFDGDILQIKVFSDYEKSVDVDRAIATVTKQVNAYLGNYPADLVHSIQAQVTEFTEPHWDIDGAAQVTRYTVTVTLRS